MQTYTGFSIVVETTPSTTVSTQHAINIDVQAARRKVAGWIVSEVSTSCVADAPVLVVTDVKAFWRVPVVFARPHSGIVGKVGEVTVNAVTGEMNTSPQLAAQYFENTVKLAQSTQSA